MMNKESYRNELDRPDLQWQTSPRHEAPNESLRWLLVADLVSSRIHLGLSSDGWWVAPGPRAATEFKPGIPLVFLLPILETPLDEARARLAEGLRQKLLTEKFLATFPFEDVVSCGLESHSNKWESLALKWAEQLPGSAKLQSVLQSAANRAATQTLRHAAQKLLASKRKEFAS